MQEVNLPSFVQKIIKSRCYVDLSRRLRLKSHPKMAIIKVEVRVMMSRAEGEVDYTYRDVDNSGYH
jgi:hypothetical protein